MLKNCPKVRNERMNMFMIYISARYETRMLLICFMVIGRFKNLRRKLGGQFQSHSSSQPASYLLSRYLLKQQGH